MFTQKQIEEIAAKLAEIAIKDSEFKMISSLNGHEYIPVLQDDENRLMPLSDLINSSQGGGSLTIQCTLTIRCPYSSATVTFDGLKASKINNVFSITKPYGSMVTVAVSADNYDTWIGVITLTKNHIVDITLNPRNVSNSGSESSASSCGCGIFCTCWEYPNVIGYDDVDTGSDTPSDDPSIITYSITVISASGKAAYINGDRCTLGKKRYFKAGTPVTVTANAAGFQSFNKVIPAIDKDYIIDLDDPATGMVLLPDNGGYLRFTVTSIELPAWGDRSPLNFDEGLITHHNVNINPVGYSGISCFSGTRWNIQSDSVPDYSENPATAPVIAVSPSSAVLIPEESFNITISS